MSVELTAREWTVAVDRAEHTENDMDWVAADKAYRAYQAAQRDAAAKNHNQKVPDAEA